MSWHAPHSSQLLGKYPHHPQRDRSTQREASWRKHLAQAYVYEAERDPRQADQLLSEYEELEHAGPDYKRVRRKAVICEPPLVHLTYNQRAKLRSQLRALAWKRRVRGHKTATNPRVTRATLDVFEALLRLQTRHGRIFPSLKLLAIKAHCATSTVEQALNTLERLGYLERIPRRARWRARLTERERQTTTAYVVKDPSDPPKTGGNGVRPLTPKIGELEI